jgi:2-methylisocitrate lyase-like PEP mutase family enzyme
MCRTTAATELLLLSAFRAMSAAAVRVYKTIRNKGTQKEVVDQMQTERSYRFPIMSSTWIGLKVIKAMHSFHE